MLSPKKALSSSVGQKFFMALTGLALVGFVITHLLGNLTLLSPSADAFNLYAHKLESLGDLLELAEVGLFAAFVIHIVTAIRIKLMNSAARPQGYRMARSKGKPSRWSWGTNHMIVSGLLLLAFLVLHIWQFKFGPSEAEGYVASYAGAEVRDLHRLVVETFQSPVWVGVYVGVMIFLGMHLWHGFWSAFQSLGAMRPRYAPLVSALAVFIAIALALGFVILPIYLHFTH